MAGRGGGRDRQSGGGGPRRFDGRRGSKAPPSRHLWIGNLSHGITEDDLTRHFLNFGDLESVAFQPGRSYAFVNFKMEEDARAAMEALNGFPVAGNPLRVEFTKADQIKAGMVHVMPRIVASISISVSTAILQLIQKRSANHIIFSPLSILSNWSYLYSMSTLLGLIIRLWRLI